MTNEFCYPSKDGVTDIHAAQWIPDGEVKAVLQISHGMVEHIMRYSPFAQYLNSRGILVVGNDHLGHGKSVTDEDHLGYFGGEEGLDWVVSDMHTLRTLTAEKYPDVPYFIMGHSMGSFMTRNYIMKYGDGLSGAVIMGTGAQSDLTLDLGMFLCKTIAAKRGWLHRSRLVHVMALGANNKKCRSPRTVFDWLSRDEGSVDKYVEDDRCGYMFTLDGFYNMFKCIKYVGNKDNVKKTADCPIFLVSGADDPVGNYGRGVKKVYDSYLKAGKNAKVKLYPDDRHEILNELDRETVYEDIGNWIAGIAEAGK